VLSGLISFCPGLKEVVETQCRGNMEEKRSKLDRDGFLVIEVEEDDCGLSSLMLPLNTELPFQLLGGPVNIF